MRGSTIVPIVCAAALAGGCAGQITGGGDDDDDGDPALAFVEPVPGASFVRDDLGVWGDLVASVGVVLDVGGAIDRVELETPAGAPLGAATGAGTATVELTTDGETGIVAIGYAGDDIVASAEVTVAVEAPAAADCHAWLDLYGVTYELGPANEGVADPVTVTTPINGVAYRAMSRETPRESFFMDCELAHSLARAAAFYRRRDLIEVADYGIYNYRCIGNEGTPPDCPRGVSQHAYALAIDIAGYTSSDGTFYSVNDDWVIDPDSEPTCEAPTEPGKDAFLHELICALKGAGVWNIVLTPNYNDAHRNHFHVDLTEGSDFIEAARSPLVDVGPDYH